MFRVGRGRAGHRSGVDVRKLVLVGLHIADPFSAGNPPAADAAAAAAAINVADQSCVRHPAANSGADLSCARHPAVGGIGADLPGTRHPAAAADIGADLSGGCHPAAEFEAAPFDQRRSSQEREAIARRCPDSDVGGERERESRPQTDAARVLAADWLRRRLLLARRLSARAAVRHPDRHPANGGAAGRSDVTGRDVAACDVTDRDVNSARHTAGAAAAASQVARVCRRGKLRQQRRARADANAA